MNYIKSYINSNTMDISNKNINTKFKIIDTELDLKINKNELNLVNKNIIDIQEKLLYLENNKNNFIDNNTNKDLVKNQASILSNFIKLEEEIENNKKDIKYLKIFVILNSIFTIYLYLKK